MGIEPTYDAVHAPYSDFEDRGHHQVCKHFLNRSTKPVYGKTKAEERTYEGGIA